MANNHNHSFSTHNYRVRIQTLQKDHIVEFKLVVAALNINKYDYSDANLIFLINFFNSTDNMRLIEREENHKKRDAVRRFIGYRNGENRHFGSESDKHFIKSVAEKWRELQKILETETCSFEAFKDGMNEYLLDDWNGEKVVWKHHMDENYLQKLINITNIDHIVELQILTTALNNLLKKQIRYDDSDTLFKDFFNREHNLRIVYVYENTQKRDAVQKLLNGEQLTDGDNEYIDMVKERWLQLRDHEDLYDYDEFIDEIDDILGLPH